MAFLQEDHELDASLGKDNVKTLSPKQKSKQKGWRHSSSD
jgi:hypothetical protein